MAWRIRSSKFRHVFGSPAKKEQCYECIKITRNAHDSNSCAANPKFLAVVTESAGGGSFLVLPVNKPGRVDINSPKVCGHSGPVLDIKWNPFNDHIIASCSDDATIKIWQIPEDGLRTNLTEFIVDLHGHQRRVGYIEWHPTAENILLSAGYDFQCIVWNIELAEPINIITCHPDTIFSIAWNYDGSLCATTCKDKKIRVIDPRDGTVISEGQCHQGTKSSKVVFIGENNRLFTTGFSKMSDRQFSIWDHKNLSKPLKTESIDSSSGVLLPFYDNDTKVVFLAGKGDGNIRYYEIVNEAPYCHYLSQYQSGSPQRGLGIMCKRGVDTAKNEIVRFFKLHTSKNMIEPISMIVPRKSEMFQDDIYPPTASSCPSLTADEWINGQNREPILISMKDHQIVSKPKSRMGKAVSRKPIEAGSKIPTAPGSISTKSTTKVATTSNKAMHTRKRTDSPKNSATPKRSVSQIRSQFMTKDGLISESPTITTYKAVKRGSSLLDTGPGRTTASKRNTAIGRSASMSAATASTEKLPASLKNIQKLSSVEDNNPNDSVCDPDSLVIYESKRPVTHTETTTRLTNTNSLMQVDKKTWQSKYVSGSVDVPSTNGVVPKSDPELQSEKHTNLQSGAITDKNGSVSPFRRSVSLRGSRIKLGRTMYEPDDNIPEEPRPFIRDNATSRRLQGSGSSSSEQFITPPSSPSKRPISGEISPFFSAQSSWADNPVYGTGTPPVMKIGQSRLAPQQNVDTTALDDILSDVLRDFETTANDFGKPTAALHYNDSPLKKASSEYFTTQAPLRESHQMHLNTQLAKSVNNIEKMSFSMPSHMGAEMTHSQPNVFDNDDRNEVDKQAMLECISIDAPDDTLIKPSKLRASMRRARASLRGGSRSSPEGDLPSPGPKEKNHSPLASPNVYSTNSDNTMSSYNGVQNLNMQMGESTCPVSNAHGLGFHAYNDKQKDRQSEINNNNNNMRFVRRTRNDERSKTDIFPRGSEFQNLGQSNLPYKVHTEPVSTNLDADRFVFKFTSENADALKLTEPTPTPFSNLHRGSFKSSRESKYRSNSQPEVVDVNSASTSNRKVWGTSQSAIDIIPHIPNLTNGASHSDMELRKAYFRQLEEIRSLKEQISMKDKRIRQLEDEVKVLRPLEADESNC